MPILALLVIGFTAGVCGSFFGLGGAFIVTPAIHILGIPIVYAVGTGIAFVVGAALASAVRHARMGNVDFKLGLILLAGTLPTVEMGKRTLIYLETLGVVGPVVRVIYFTLLVGIGLYTAYDILWRKRHGKRATVSPGDRRPRVISARPMLALSRSRLARISLWQVILIGAVTGFVAGFMGIAGGMILVTALIYIVGFPPAVAAGTSLFVGSFIATYASLSYALAGRVELSASIILLAAAVPGIQIGILAVRFVSGQRWRLFFAITMILVGVSVAIKQLALWRGSPGLQDLSTWLVMGTTGIMDLIIIGIAVMGLTEQRRTVPDGGLSET